MPAAFSSLSHSRRRESNTRCLLAGFGAIIQDRIMTSTVQVGLIIPYYFQAPNTVGISCFAKLGS
ncbi:hypothetical protein BJY04DRAFT_196360 [Aspergillus karnatakaensis]|uniref:uncharacterized protein n=1 Tax=Aspergillus karnatakaensis TaxID=1810916 RepID=UPI003CCD310B